MIKDILKIVNLIAGKPELHYIYRIQIQKSLHHEKKHYL